MLRKLIINLLILFILLSQFATITHAIEHQFVEDEHESCSICIHQINSNNIVINSNDSNHIHHYNDENINDVQNSLYTLSLSLNSARSPPDLLN